MKVLVITSEWDLPTRYMNNAALKVASMAGGMGHSVRVLSGYAATHEALVGEINAFSPDLVIFSGHGSPRFQTTYGGTAIVTSCTDNGILAGRNVLYLSCLTGQVLVPDTVAKGALAAAGFTSEFTWNISPPYDPDLDPYWKPFERMILESSQAVLGGGGWAAWHRALHAASNAEEARWGGSADPAASSIILNLVHDRDAGTFMTLSGEADGGGGGDSGILLLVPLALLALS